MLVVTLETLRRGRGFVGLPRGLMGKIYGFLDRDSGKEPPQKRARIGGNSEQARPFGSVLMCRA